MNYLACFITVMQMAWPLVPMVLSQSLVVFIAPENRRLPLPGN
jgi:hypothetical protein